MKGTQWKVLKPATEIWANNWIKILETTVRLPTGVEAQFYMMDAPDGVAVLALDDDRHAVLNCQFRPALGKVTLELPAGSVNDGEDHLEAACRELAEETGLRVKDMQYLGSFYRNPARDTGSMHIYFARVAGSVAVSLERYEYIETVRVPLDDLLRQVLDHEIRDVATVFAVLMLRSRLERGSIRL